MQHLTIEIARKLLAQQLPRAAADQWETHVRECERCRALLDGEREWSGLFRLSKLPDGEEPAGAESRAARIAEIAGVAVPAAPVRRAGLGGWLIAVLLAACLAWQLRSLDVASRGPGSVLGGAGSPVADADALQTLDANDWLIDDFEAVDQLAALLAPEER